MSKFGVGDEVTRNVKPLGRIYTVLKTNNDDTYVCSWNERDRMKKKLVTKIDTFKEIELTPYNRSIRLVNRRNLR